MSYLVGTIGVVVFFMLMSVAAAVLEKRPVWYFGDPEERPFAPPHSYRTTRVGDAWRVGFQSLAFVRDVRDKYDIGYELLVSPQRDCFAVIGEGKMWSLPIKGSILYTPAPDGRLFYSTDSQSCVEVDLSGLWKSQLAPVATFGELWDRHQKWIASNAFIPLPFAAGEELQTYYKLRDARLQLMAQMGLITFVDEERTRWHYTLWSGVKLGVINHVVGFYRALFKNWGKVEGSTMTRKRKA